MILRQIRRPFAFNTIKSKDLAAVRTYVPGAITIALTLLYFVLPKQPDIIGDKRYLDYLLQIVGILPGFYIAALAAGATFANPSLDEPMPGKRPPTLKISRMGQSYEDVPTIRIFICHLFAYLSATSLVLAFALLLCIELNPSMEYLTATFENIRFVVFATKSAQALAVMAVTFYVAKLAVVTLHGLYFLAERMHLANS